MMKKIQLKQFMESVTDWTKFNDFTKAKIKLTFYYLMVIFILINIFVWSLFTILKVESTRYQKNINLYLNNNETIYIDKEKNLTIVSMQPQILSLNTKDFINIHNIFVDVIKTWLLRMEFVILILAGFISYILSGIAMKPIEDKNKKQKKFLSDVSHELKNPLSAIKMNLEISKKQDTWMIGEIKETFSDLENEVSRLIEITNNLLTLESNNLDTTKNFLNIKIILNKIISNLKPYSKNKNIKIISTINNFNTIINKNDIQKILFNILHNAIKFSKQNGIIEVKLSKNGILKIKDYGLGISSKDSKYIFDRFYKSDNSRTFKEDTGSGLGLSIVKDLAKKNNIKISFNTKLNQWTEFTLYFK